jgi:hypothetical protein
MNLKDVNAVLDPFILESIEYQLTEEIRTYAEGRKRDIERGAETPELASLMVEKFGYGMAKAAHIIGLDSKIMAEVDRLIAEIDPEFRKTRQKRWDSRPAGLLLTV